MHRMKDIFENTLSVILNNSLRSMQMVNQLDSMINLDYHTIYFIPSKYLFNNNL